MVRYALATMTLFCFGLFAYAALSLNFEGAVYGLGNMLVWGGLTWVAWPRPGFLDWLGANRKAIEYRSARYQDLPITLDTVMVRYEVLISLIHLTSVKESDYVVRGSLLGQATRWGCILASLVLGWWSIPGLIEMGKLLERNRTHANSVTVRQLLARSVAAAEPKPRPRRWWQRWRKDEVAKPVAGSRPATVGDGAFDANEVKLELAAACVEMDDREGAEEILGEVLREGTNAQRERARAMLAGLSGPKPGSVSNYRR